MKIVLVSLSPSFFSLESPKNDAWKDRTSESPGIANWPLRVNHVKLCQRQTLDYCQHRQTMLCQPEEQGVGLPWSL